MFADEAVIVVSSGHGGEGAVSFRREKFVPKGGPDGGNGGKGGDVIFVVRENLKTLRHLKARRIYRAEDGHSGRGKKKHGKNGINVEIPIPPGTIVIDPNSEEILHDFKNNHKLVFLRGGRGGKGNKHFASSTHRTPRFAQPGEKGNTRELQIQLNIIADVGLVGFPNAGKSTLLSVLTNADPQIGPYPFTTRVPNLGVLRFEDMDIIIADIPGIIEGASGGAGLGIRFLKHVSRSVFLIFLVDVADDRYLEAVEILKNELESYSSILLEKEYIIVGTKMDIAGAEERFLNLKCRYPSETVLGISSFTGAGIDELSLILRKTPKHSE